MKSMPLTTLDGNAPLEVNGRPREQGASSAAGTSRLGRRGPERAEGMLLPRRGGDVNLDPLGHRIDTLIDFIPLAPSRFGAALPPGDASAGH